MGGLLVALFPNVICVPVVGSAPFALFPSVIRAPVRGRAYSGTPTLLHAGLYDILRKLESGGPKYFMRMVYFPLDGKCPVTMASDLCAKPRMI